jgi:hypothetical protein
MGWNQFVHAATLIHIGKRRKTKRGTLLTSALVEGHATVAVGWEK